MGTRLSETFENEVLKAVHGLNRDNVGGKWRILYKRIFLIFTDYQYYVQRI
jgi:hypothetical protein